MRTSSLLRRRALAVRPTTSKLRSSAAIAVIASVDAEAGEDTGALSLTTGTLNVADILDRDTSRQTNFGVSGSFGLGGGTDSDSADNDTTQTVTNPDGAGQPTQSTEVARGSALGTIAQLPTVTFGRQTSDFEQTTAGVIGEGEIEARDDAAFDPDAVNRDIDDAQIVTCDEQTNIAVNADFGAIADIAANFDGVDGSSTIERFVNEVRAATDGDETTRTQLQEDIAVFSIASTISDAADTDEDRAALIFFIQALEVDGKSLADIASRLNEAGSEEIDGIIDDTKEYLGEVFLQMHRLDLLQSNTNTILDEANVALRARAREFGSDDLDVRSLRGGIQRLKNARTAYSQQRRRLESLEGQLQRTHDPQKKQKLSIKVEEQRNVVAQFYRAYGAEERAVASTARRIQSRISSARGAQNARAVRKGLDAGLSFADAAACAIAKKPSSCIKSAKRKADREARERAREQARKRKRNGQRRRVRSCSFSGDTLVKTEKGMIAIQNIIPGEHRVWSKDETSGDMAFKDIIKQYSNRYESQVAVEIYDHKKLFHKRLSQIVFILSLSKLQAR